MFRNWVLWAFFSVLCHFAVAQKVNVSPTFKLPGHTEKIRIIGKNQDGYVVWISGNSEVFAVFNNDLKLSSVKTFELKNNDGFIQHVQLYKNGGAVYFLRAEPQHTLLLAQVVNSKFQHVGNPVVVDTLFDNIETANANLRIKTSVDQRYLVFHIPVFNTQGIETMQLVCVDKNTARVYKQFLPIHKPEREITFAKTAVDTAGNAVLVFSDTRNALKVIVASKKVSENATTTAQLRWFSVPFAKTIFGEPYIDIDNKNNRLQISGFYDNEEGMAEAAAYGFFYKNYDYTTGVLSDDQTVAFPDSFIRELTGRDASVTNNRLYTFNIRKVLQREDGGVLIAAESSFRDRRQEPIVSMSMMTPYTSYRNITTFVYNDIVAFSMNKSGTIEWNKVMRKKQYSENDNGNNSSFFCANLKNALYFIFPEEISTVADANEYILQSNGDLDKRHLFNQEEKDVFLIPKLGKQTAKNEAIIPSVKRGDLKLLRLTF